MHKPYIVITAVISCLIIFFSFFLILQKKDYSKLSEECNLLVTNALAQKKINKDFLVRTSVQPMQKFRTKYVFLEKEFLVTPEYNLQGIKKSLSEDKSLKKFSLGGIRSKKDKKEQILSLDFYFKKLKIYHLIIREKSAIGRLAVVLDDWGYNKDIFEDSLNLNIPITYAILPNLPHSAEIAAKLYNLKTEFILHLPLEPHENNNLRLEQNTILTTMNKTEIIRILENDFADIPHLKGINNHMGSKATENEQLMNIIFGEMKQKNLYFLDSFVTEYSVCEKAAKRNNLPFLRRDVFLDNENDKASIKNKLIEAKKIVKEKGSCLAIGHARTLTIAALKEISPSFRREGIIFVYASELLNNMPLSDKTPKINGE